MKKLAILGALLLVALAYLIYEVQGLSSRNTASPEVAQAEPEAAPAARELPPPASAPAAPRPLPAPLPTAPPPAAPTAPPSSPPTEPTAAAPEEPGPPAGRFAHQEDALTVVRGNGSPAERREALDWLRSNGGHEVLSMLRDIAEHDPDPEVRSAAVRAAKDMERRFTEGTQ